MPSLSRSMNWKPSLNSATCFWENWSKTLLPPPPPLGHFRSADWIVDMAPNTPAASKKKKQKKGPKGGGGGSNVFDQFSQKQVAEFNEGFQFMDRDKDGIIGAGDIRATADEVGISLTDQQVDAMVADCSAAINFTQLINMFGQKQQGGATDEDA